MEFYDRAKINKGVISRTSAARRAERYELRVSEGETRSMIAVIDVSAAIEIILQKEKGELFKSKYEQASWVIAPDLYVSELSNVMWKYFKAKVISHEDCVQFVDDGIQMIDDFIDGRELWKEALGEGIKRNHSIYDMY